MSKSKQHVMTSRMASALALVAFSASACAQEAPDTAYDSQATDTREQATDAPAMEAPEMDAGGMEPTVEDQASMAATGNDEASQAAATLGVSELNDIENWKVTNAGMELGEIDRLGVDRATGEILAVVGLEGVVGVNMKEVGIPLKSLTKAGDETLSTDLTKDELQQQRDIDPWDAGPQDLDESTTQ